MRQGTGEFGDARTDKRLANRRGAKGERMAGIGKDSENTKRRKRKKKKTQKSRLFGTDGSFAYFYFLGEVFGENGV